MNRAVLNALWIIGCRIMQSILSLVVSMMSARFLGPTNYGMIQYASSLVTFIMPVMQLGFTTIIVKEFIDNPKQEGAILGTTIASCFCAALLSMVGVVCFVAIANVGETETIIVCVLMSINLLFSAIEMIQYWFQAKLLSKYTALISLISYIIISGYKIILLILEKSVYWFAASYALDVMLISIGLLIAYNKIKGPKLTVSLSLGKKMFSKSKYYILSGLMISIFTQTDRIMLDNMIDSAATGYYSAAVMCASLSAFVFGAIIDSGGPLIHEAKIQGKEQFEKSLKQLYSIVIYLSLAQCVVMVLLPEFIIGLTYGEEFYPAVSTLKIVVWYTTFAYVGKIRNIWILAESLQRYQILIDFSGAITNVCLNLLFIPILGVNGAAIASLVSQFVVNVGIGFIIKPIRRGNWIMLQALNPKYLFEMIQGMLRQRMKGLKES